MRHADNRKRIRLGDAVLRNVARILSIDKKTRAVLSEVRSTIRRRVSNGRGIFEGARGT